MKPRQGISVLDQIGLIIIGSGASLVYYLFEKVLLSSQTLTIVLTIGVILLIAVFTQYLLNKINKQRYQLYKANTTLEEKVEERTAALSTSESRYRTIFENTGSATIIVSADMRILLANSMFEAIAGQPKEAVEEKVSWLTFLDEKSRRMLVSEKLLPVSDPEAPSRSVQFECRFIGRKNVPRNMLITYATIPGTSNCVASLADITELKEAERQIYHQAFHDALTGLPNRALFLEHLNMAIKRAKRRSDYRFAVLYLDLDRFKLVNDSLGHSTGDRLLVAFAERLQASLREIDTLARLGGDEFVILLEDIEAGDYALMIAERLQQLLQHPFRIEGAEIFAPASVGIVLDTQKYDRPEDVIRDADAAMYHAKEKGTAQFRIFDQKLHERAFTLLHIETDLRKALKRSEFELYYQPIVSLDNDALFGFEALIRWNHPQRGIVYPDTFIPIAEETGLIIPIGRWVLEEACRTLRHWQEALGSELPLCMSVNISSKQLLKPGLAEEIKDVVEANAIPPGLLKLEITESALLDDLQSTIRFIEALKAYGVQIVIDDFGTGYSSMSYLQQLPVDTLKVDRSFVSRIKQSQKQTQSLVETMISLAHKLNLNVVAEGVETAEQHLVLEQMSCQLAQGHLFSKPLPQGKMQRLMETIFRLAKQDPNARHRLQDLLAVSEDES